MGIFSRRSTVQPVRKTMTTRDLIRREAQVGGTLFGPIPHGRARQFFCLDEHSWVWHEEWKDERTGSKQSVTTRYEVRPNGILKAQGEQPYHYVDIDEANRLIQAIRLYNKYVSKLVYGYNL